MNGLNFEIIANKMKGILGILFLMMLSGGMFAQRSAEDSLLTLLEQAEDSERQMEIYYDLAVLNQQLHPRKSKTYFIKSLREAELNNNLEAQLNINYGLGVVNDYLSNYEEANRSFLTSLDFAERLRDDSIMINIYNSLGVVALRNGVYESALEYYLQALKLSEQMPVNSTKVKVICNAGHVFYYQNQLDKAMSYYQRALEVSRSLNNSSSIAECLQHIGLVKHELGDAKGAEVDFQEALRIFAQAGSVHSMERANLYQNMGVMFKGYGDYNSSQAYYDSSLSIYQRMGNIEGQAQTFVNVGELYLVSREFDKAENVLQKAMKLSADIGSLEGKKYSAASLAKVYEAQGNLKKSLEYQKLFTSYSDSLMSEQSSARISELEAKYNSERNEQEIAMLRTEQNLLDAELAKESAEKRQWMLGFSLLILALLSIVIFIFFRQKTMRLQRQKKRQKEFSEKLIHWQELERKRIAGELHDGLGQSLVMLKNKVLKMQSNGLNGNSTEQLEGLAANITNTIQEVRGISYALRPFQLEILGLQRSIEEMVEEFAGSSGMIIKAYIDELEGEFSKEEEVNIFRIIQECLTNVVKHSKASKANVHLALGDNYLNLRISDDGIGFDPARSLSSKEGFGLKGVKERVRLLSGTFKIESDTSGDCRVMIKVPLKGKLNEYSKADSHSR